MTQMTRNPI